tara:strand:+ start:3552 stop:3899 length:348 start_codon:yes stop_codon:yes gene_type:complete
MTGYALFNAPYQKEALLGFHLHNILFWCNYNLISLLFFHISRSETEYEIGKYMESLTIDDEVLLRRSVRRLKQYAENSSWEMNVWCLESQRCTERGHADHATFSDADIVERDVRG